MDGIVESTCKQRAEVVTPKLTNAWALIALGLVLGCGEDVPIRQKNPTDKEALRAVQKLIQDGAQLLTVPLPKGIAIASATVSGCASAAPQEGRRCEVAVATVDIPIVGGMSATLPLRLVRSSDGSWTAYLN